MNAIKTAKNLGFHLSLGIYSEATRNRWFWFVDASGRAGEAWRIIRKGLDLTTHPGFDTEEAAAVDAIRAMVAELQATLPPRVQTHSVTIDGVTWAFYSDGTAEVVS